MQAAAPCRGAPGMLSIFLYAGFAINDGKGWSDIVFTDQDHQYELEGNVVIAKGSYYFIGAAEGSLALLRIRSRVQVNSTATVLFKPTEALKELMPEQLNMVTWGTPPPPPPPDTSSSPPAAIAGNPWEGMDGSTSVFPASSSASAPTSTTTGATGGTGAQ